MMRILVLFLVVLSTTPLNAAGSRPNILVILTDDQGWGDLGLHGNKSLRTPHLDALAKRSRRFERFFVSPVCAPTRASFLTGRYHLRTGVFGVTAGRETMRAEESTLAEILRAAGYVTACIGKWHNGAHFPNHPLGQGFDHFFGFCAGHWNNYFDTTLEDDGRKVATKGFISDVLTDRTLTFLEKNRAKPFFCYLVFNAPHGPYQVPDRYFDPYRKAGLDPQLAAIYGMVSNIDDNVGRILAKLEELGIADDTIVVFFTDNGPQTDRFNGGMRGRKGSVHEGGIRVPCFVSWPGRWKEGRTIPHIAAHIDLLPTLAELSGTKVPQDLRLDGVSLVPLLDGRDPPWKDRRIFTHQAGRGKVGAAPGSVRTQRYRLVLEKKVQLYDMVADPGEKKDIAGAHPAIVRELQAAYDAWFRDVTKVPLAAPPIPVGHPESPNVELFAPEAQLHGNVRFKGKAGWANDWIVGWTSPKDEIAWDLDVVRPGKYAITLRYACPEKDLGANLILEAGGKTARAIVDKAHGGPKVPSPDRVPRGEVYEMVWGELGMGTLDLPRGKTRLVLRADVVGGSQVMELKAVRLRRVETPVK